MFENMKQIFALLKASKKIWLLPALLFLVIIALVFTVAQISPVPIFIYPFI